MDLTKLTAWLKLKPRYLATLVIVGGVLLFFPEQWLSRLGLQAIVASYRGWIGGAFLISGILLLTNGLAYLSEPLQGTINDWRRAWVYSKHLKDLSRAEKAILAKYFDEATQTQELNVSDGVAQGLVAKKILYRASSVGDMSGYFAYNIQPWAWRYLRDHPERLQDDSVKA